MVLGQRLEWMLNIHSWWQRAFSSTVWKHTTWLIFWISVWATVNYILELSHNRNYHLFTNQKSKYLFYQKKVKINLDSIIQLSATEFLVPSETIADKLYKVYMETSLCKCPQGFLKGPCKHKSIVSHTFKLKNFDTLPHKMRKWGHSTIFSKLEVIDKFLGSDLCMEKIHSLK